MNEVITRKSDAFQTMNKAEFVGSVVHKYRPNDDMITLTLAIGREGRDGHDAVDYPNITFYGENADIIDKAIDVKAGDYPRVCVDAEIQTSRKVRDGKPQYFQNIIGMELRKAPTNMERITGQKALGSHKLDSVNEVCLMGRVVNVFPITRNSAGGINTIGTILTIKTVSGRHVNFPKVTCFGANSGLAISMKRDEAVCVTGRIQTRYNKENDQRYETIVCSEVTRLDE